MIEPQQGWRYEELLRFARDVESLGFEGLFRSDHYARMEGGDVPPGSTDAWITLAGLARETSRIRLGTLVSSATFRLPGVLAVMAAQVDEMSMGRLELGLGAGWFEPEHHAYGIPFPASRAERAKRWREQLEILVGLWRCLPGELFSYEGEYYSLKRCPALPRPVQRPHPPIIVGGAGLKRTPTIAAQYADEFNIAFQSMEHIQKSYSAVEAACVEIGRDPKSVIKSCCRTVCCGRNTSEIQTRRSRIGKDDEFMQRAGVMGSPEELVESLRQYEAIGADCVYLQVIDLADIDHLQLIASVRRVVEGR